MLLKRITILFVCLYSALSICTIPCYAADKDYLNLGKVVCDISTCKQYEAFGDKDSYFHTGLIAPGDKYMFSIELTNPTDKRFYSSLNLIDTNPTDNILNKIVQLKVCQGDNVLYDGNLTSDVSLIDKNLVPEQSMATIDFYIYFPPASDNTYQAAYFEMIWEIISSEIPIDTSAPTTEPTTEDTTTTETKKVVPEPDYTEKIETTVPSESLTYYEEGTAPVSETTLEPEPDDITETTVVIVDTPEEPTETDVTFEPIPSDNVPTGVMSKDYNNYSWIFIIIAASFAMVGIIIIKKSKKN